MTLVIREIAYGERDQLLELLQQLIPEDLPLPAEDALEKKWAEIRSDKKIHCVIAEDAGRIVSSCTLIIVPNLTRGTMSYGLIENVVTREEYRKRGIGQKVVQYALSIAWRNNCYKVMLLTSKKDEATLRFYRNCGFESGIKTGFVAYKADYAGRANTADPG